MNGWEGITVTVTEDEVIARIDNDQKRAAGDVKPVGIMGGSKGGGFHTVTSDRVVTQNTDKS